ncbi:MAG: MFS transporter [Betaproteobacteria bacterium]|nr:MFS transporter [Betaproteobacteria bacterium]
MNGSATQSVAGIDSGYAWMRLVSAVALSTTGGVGMWAVVVALPTIQAAFGVARAGASLPYTLTMVCFGLGGIAMGRLTDRFGIVIPVALGSVTLCTGFVTASHAESLTAFALAQGILVGFGASATFAPLLADTSHWFVRRRGIAVAVVASGNYLAGTLWPPVVQHFIGTAGWRATYLGIGVFCVLVMAPLAWTLRRRPPPHDESDPNRPSQSQPARIAVRPVVLQGALIVAGVGCCVAMSMPQVHIVAYCGDLGYGPARGAQMLSLMLGLGIVSRLTFGWISDRIGGLRTLLLGSSLQALALLMFVPFRGLVSLYLISAMFGLFQGGIVPSYAIIIREYFSPREAGARVGAVITATLFGMALGGWMSGAIFDLTGSYRAAFVNGVAWNLLNLAIVVWLLRRRVAPVPVPAVT